MDDPEIDAIIAEIAQKEESDEEFTVDPSLAELGIDVDDPE